MEEKQKIFIRGVEGRGNEIIKILTDLGAKNNSEWTDKYMSSYYIYIINHKGNISSVSINSETARIIMDNYHELHLPEQRKGGDWKDGDILTRKDNNNLFCVYQKPADNGKGFLCHVYATKDVLFTEVTVPTDPADNYRKATDAEKSTFYSLIDNHHMRWDAENKQLTDKEELPEQWEDGNILIRKDRIEYIVFRKYSNNTMFYNYDFTISKDENIWFSIAGEEYLYKTENFRLATSEEIKQFYNLLHKMNKDWDSEKKHLVKLKWKSTLDIYIE